MLIQLVEKCGTERTIDIEKTEELMDSTVIIHQGVHYAFDGLHSNPRRGYRFVECNPPYEVTVVEG